MKLVTLCSFKGGAGKTTALMGLCSALAIDGQKVALFEADENRPLTSWKKNASRQNTWDPACEVFIADEMSRLETAYQQAEENSFDYALADTHGGSSDLNNTIIASSDYLLVPTMLTPLDADEALATYRYIIELLMAEKLNIPATILFQRVPFGKLTSSQRSVGEMLTALPRTNAPMYERDAFAAMKERGMLHLTLDNVRADPAMRLILRNLTTAMDELHLLARFVRSELES